MHIKLFRLGARFKFHSTRATYKDLQGPMNMLIAITFFKQTPMVPRLLNGVYLIKDQYVA